VPFCFWHSPDTADDAADARRLGEVRRRRERTLSGAYDVAGLESTADVRRILEIAVLDTLGLDNSITRIRVLIAAARGAAGLLEVEDADPLMSGGDTGNRHCVDDPLGPRPRPAPGSVSRRRPRRAPGCRLRRRPSMA